jgi:hypothetical protein
MLAPVYNPEFQLSASDRQKWQELKVPMNQWDQVACLMVQVPAESKPKKHLYERLWRTFDATAPDPHERDINYVVEDLLCGDNWEDYKAFISRCSPTPKRLVDMHVCQGVEWVNYSFSPRIMAELWRIRAKDEEADLNWDKVVAIVANQVAYRHTTLAHIQFVVRQLVYIFNSTQGRVEQRKTENQVYRALFVNTGNDTDVCLAMYEDPEIPPVEVLRWLWEQAGRPLLSHDQIVNMVCADLHVRDKHRRKFYLDPITFMFVDSDSGDTVFDYLNRAVTVTTVLGRDTVRECIESRWYSPPVRDLPSPVPSPAPMN